MALRQQLPVDDQGPRRLARGSRSSTGPTTRPRACPGSVRGAFVEGISFATLGEIPVLAGPDFTIYAGDNFLAKTLESVWAGQSKPDDAMTKIQTKWQSDLDDG